MLNFYNCKLQPKQIVYCSDKLFTLKSLKKLNLNFAKGNLDS